MTKKDICFLTHSFLDRVLDCTDDYKKSIGNCELIDNSQRKGRKWLISGFTPSKKVT